MSATVTKTKEDIERELEEKKLALKKLRRELKEAQDKDWKADAQEVMDKMAEEFVPGTAYLNHSKEFVVADRHVTSPIGGIRNLWRVLTGRPGVIAAAKRRATNSPIQGFSTEIVKVVGL
jgi:DNA polymerase I-like protein with 3'-5' exonuclease and polymerase domains